jgi:hypothetical protein
MSDAVTMEEEELAASADRELKKSMKKKRGKMSAKNKILLIVVSLLMMSFLRTGFIFVIIGLLPSIVAYYIDVSVERYTFRTIFATNLCGMLPYIERMLQQGPSSTVLQSVMGNANNWFIIYGSALIGWLLIEICPLVAEAMIKGFHQTQIARINHVQKKVESEWGSEVTEFSKIKDEDD